MQLVSFVQSFEDSIQYFDPQKLLKLLKELSVESFPPDFLFQSQRNRGQPSRELDYLYF
jgi:hypothetical protein